MTVDLSLLIKNLDRDNGEAVGRDGESNVCPKGVIDRLWQSNLIFTLNKQKVVVARPDELQFEWKSTALLFWTE